MHELAYDLGYLPVTPPQPAGISSIYHGPICGYGSMDPPDQPSRHIGTNIGISTTEGVDAYLTDPAREDFMKEARVETVAGFPALVSPIVDKTLGNGCGVEVDVHDGQYLDVQSGADPGETKSSTARYCAEAKRVAGMAIQTIESQR